jgi:hypothetical protein
MLPRGDLLVTQEYYQVGRTTVRRESPHLRPGSRSRHAGRLDLASTAETVALMLVGFCNRVAFADDGTPDRSIAPSALRCAPAMHVASASRCRPPPSHRSTAGPEPGHRRERLRDRGVRSRPAHLRFFSRPPKRDRFADGLIRRLVEVATASKLGHDPNAVGLAVRHIENAIGIDEHAMRTRKLAP